MDVLKWDLNIYSNKEEQMRHKVSSALLYFKGGTKMYRIQNVSEVEAIKHKLSEEVYEKLVDDVKELENKSFDGCSLILETKDDLSELKSMVDYTVHLSEEVLKLNEYLWCLYLMNNEYSVNVLVPITIAPQGMLDEVEEK